MLSDVARKRVLKLLLVLTAMGAIVYSLKMCDLFTPRDRVGVGLPCKITLCDLELSCFEGICRTSSWVESTLEERMLSESLGGGDRAGGDVPIEQHRGDGGVVPADDTVGGAVRVRKASASFKAFAICAANERLIGGGCESVSRFRDVHHDTESFPSGYSETDTLGARWKCKGFGTRVTAYALCQSATAASKSESDRD